MADRLVSELVAVLGGGQLGRMLGLAGIPLGVRFRFLDPSRGAPAAAVGDLVVGRARRRGRAAEVARGRDRRHLRVGGRAGRRGALPRRAAVPVRPGARSLEVSQDRLVEKETFRRLGIAHAPRSPRSTTAPSSTRAVDEVGGCPRC